MCPFKLFQKKNNDPYTQLTEQITHYKNLYTPITTDVKNAEEKEEKEEKLGGRPQKEEKLGGRPQIVLKNQQASNKGTYFMTTSPPISRRAAWTATWAPLIVHDEKTHSLTLGSELKRVIDSQSSEQDRLYVVDQKGEPIDLFSLNYSYDKASLHVQKHEFCRELKSFLAPYTLLERQTPSPSDLKEELDKLITKYPRALEGNFSKTKNIVNQLKERAKKTYPDDHALDEPTIVDKIKQAGRKLTS